MTLREANTIYMVGIKGVGMTGLAQILQGMGKRVSGSDTAEEFFTQVVLEKLGIPYVEGFAAENILDAQLVIYATAYPEDHIERVEATQRGMTQLSYPEALGELTKGMQTIAVCGSHGKTTTTAMLGQALETLGKDPTVLVGSRVNAWGTNARVGKSNLFVLEADEYQNKLRFLNPTGMVITNIDWDHPDFFPNPESYRKVFTEFVARLPSHGWVVANQRDKESPLALAGVAERVVWFDPEAPLPDAVREVIVGAQNCANANAAFAALRCLGVEAAEAVSSLTCFRGTARRMEEKGTISSLTVVDDYAHHPAEIRATIAALRQRYPLHRVAVLFQPHTFSRTKVFLSDFVKALKTADAAFVTDIYGSAREKAGAVDGRALAAAFRNGSDHYVPFEKAAETLEAKLLVPKAAERSFASRATLFVTMGAGDVWKVGEEVVKRLSRYA